MLDDMAMIVSLLNVRHIMTGPLILWNLVRLEVELEGHCTDFNQPNKLAVILPGECLTTYAIPL